MAHYTMIENQFIYVSLEKLQTLLSENYHVQLLDSEIMQVLGDNICKHSKKSTNPDTPDAHTICMRKLNKNTGSGFCSRHCPEKKKEYNEKRKQKKNDSSCQDSSTDSHISEDLIPFEETGANDIIKRPIPDAELDTKDLLIESFDSIKYSMPPLAALSKARLCKMLYEFFQKFVQVIQEKDANIVAESQKFLKDITKFYIDIGIFLPENWDNSSYHDENSKTDKACKMLRNKLEVFEIYAVELGVYTDAVANLMDDISDLFDRHGLPNHLDE